MWAPQIFIRYVLFRERLKASLNPGVRLGHMQLQNSEGKKSRKCTHERSDCILIIQGRTKV
jgi:hypothetical protein